MDQVTYVWTTDPITSTSTQMSNLTQLTSNGTEVKFERKAEFETKTPSQRLRGVLYVLWEQTGKSGDFETFYRQKMEGLINLIKNKLS